MSGRRPSKKKTVALKKLAEEIWKDNNHRLPTNALSAIVNAEKFRYIPSEIQEDSKSPKEEKSITTHEEFLAAKSGKERLFEERFQSLGCPTKYDKIIIFLLFCMASQEISSETIDVQEISARAKVPEKTYNQVVLSVEHLGAVATRLFGYNSPRSRSLLLTLLKNLASVEFRIKIPIDATKILLKQSILFSVGEDWIEDKVTGEKTFAGVTISLGDLFFYKNCHRYSFYDIEKMLEGLSGEHGDLFGDLVFYFSRYLPAAVTQMNKGEEYEAAAAIETVYTGYRKIGKRQNKYRAREAIKAVSADVSLGLQRGEIEVVGEEIKCKWRSGNFLKKQNNED